ncbi:MAG: alpha/beta hydrolase domain-containing protein [Gammaproteobacteria bacterium]|jgi:hypothetical protein
MSFSSSLRSNRLPAFFLCTAYLCAASIASAQGPFGQTGPRQPPQLPNLPEEPTAVTLPRISGEISGPGPIFDSAPSQTPGHGLTDYDYVTNEYFVSGTADGKPYTTRLVVRRPADDDDFSGLVLAESMHSSGAAHAFEFTAMYVMDSGHAAVEILTVPPERLTAFNAQRYGDLEIQDGQANDILAQVGALLKSPQGPFGDVDVRRMVLSGSSMSSGTLINYLSAHMVYRTSDMQHIYDGFMPTSVGTTIPAVDVPLIQMPTMHEFETNVPRRQDSDEVGRQFRLYEVSGIGHVDSRDNIRLLPNPCSRPLSTFPAQAYMSVGLYHLFRWVDEGIPAPRAERILLDRNTYNDGSQMLLDEHGNGRGGIRNPYVDVPTAKYVAVNTPAEPPIEDPNWWITENTGGANIMCRLSAYQLPFTKAQLRDLYGTPANYRRRVTARLDELEAEGWSLPVYRELILADARAVEF